MGLVIEGVFDGGDLLTKEGAQIQALVRKIAAQAVGIFIGVALSTAAASPKKRTGRVDHRMIRALM